MLIVTKGKYDPMIQTLFSPNGGCTTEIIRRIDNAKKSIYVLSYVLTSFKIALALHTAFKAKVDVQVVCDAKGSVIKGSMINDLHKGNIPIWLDHKHNIMHNKVMIIDEGTVITGSFNWTDNAEHFNGENLLILDNEVTKDYHLDFVKHRNHSIVYTDQVRGEQQCENIEF